MTSDSGTNTTITIARIPPQRRIRTSHRDQREIPRSPLPLGRTSAGVRHRRPAPKTSSSAQHKRQHLITNTGTYVPLISALEKQKAQKPHHRRRQSLVTMYTS
jgi:hypothetical protein